MRHEGIMLEHDSFLYTPSIPSRPAAHQADCLSNSYNISYLFMDNGGVMVHESNEFSK